jgi:hypothetical protein
MQIPSDIRLDGPSSLRGSAMIPNIIGIRLKTKGRFNRFS